MILIFTYSKLNYGKASGLDTIEGRVGTACVRAVVKTPDMVSKGSGFESHLNVQRKGILHLFVIECYGLKGRGEVSL